MSFDNYETQTKYIKGSKTCVYCGNQNLVIDDSFDEYGNYSGTRNYCECDQAKIEQQMKREMEQVDSKKKEIENKYKEQLVFNEKAISKAELEDAISESLRNHVMYGNLHDMTKEKFLAIAGKLFDREVWEEKYEDDFED